MLPSIIRALAPQPKENILPLYIVKKPIYPLYEVVVRR
jgi:hypothetical protein